MRGTRLGAAWFALWCCWHAPAAAQTIDEIVAKHLAARGGAERWQSLRSLRMTGRVLAGPGREALVVREIKRPRRVRTEFTFQGITGVYAFDGTRGWQISPLTGSVVPETMDPGNLQASVEQTDLEGPLVGARQKGYAVEMIGRETISGRDAIRLRLTPKAGRPIEQYLDSETFLLLRSDAMREVRGHPVRVETTFAEYRTVGGLVFPHALEIGASGRPERVQISVESIDINPAIDDGRFRVPSGSRR